MRVIWVHPMLAVDVATEGKEWEQFSVIMVERFEPKRREKVSENRKWSFSTLFRAVLHNLALRSLFTNAIARKQSQSQYVFPPQNMNLNSYQRDQLCSLPLFRSDQALPLTSLPSLLFQPMKPCHTNSLIYSFYKTNQLQFLNN